MWTYSVYTPQVEQLLASAPTKRWSCVWDNTITVAVTESGPTAGDVRWKHKAGQDRKGEVQIEAGQNYLEKDELDVRNVDACLSHCKNHELSDCLLSACKRQG